MLAFLIMLAFTQMVKSNDESNWEHLSPNEGIKCTRYKMVKCIFHYYALLKLKKKKKKATFTPSLKNVFNRKSNWFYWTLILVYLFNSLHAKTLVIFCYACLRTQLSKSLFFFCKNDWRTIVIQVYVSTRHFLKNE